MIDAQTAADAAPWWGVPLIAGLFAILGVVGSQVVIWTLDRRKAQRDDAGHWRADRRQTYAAFLAASTALYWKLWSEWQEGIDEKAATVFVNELALRRYEIELIASTEVSSVAKEAFEALVAMADACKPTENDTEARGPLSRRFLLKQGELIRTARRELGVDENSPNSARGARPSGRNLGDDLAGSAPGDLRRRRT